ncbi:2'-5' RNA ligase family protein [Cohnella soli]|uniref:RNA 2',3'-cyclic phosphodiesterase n=1 Tax=Cohnella soli TaxID=425005 RepID=A0ABW0HP38_9BACL
MNNFRLFIGLPLPEAPTAALASIMPAIAGAGVRFRKWTHPQDLHITLHFLGDTPEARIHELAALTAAAAAKAAPFTLALARRPGVFGPPAAAPRVLWCGLAAPSASDAEGNTAGDAPMALAALHALHAALGERLRASGFATEARSYRAHVTLARDAAAGYDAAALEAAWRDAFPAVPPVWPAAEVALYRTHLGRRPSYEAIGRYSIGTDSPTNILL